MTLLKKLSLVFFLFCSITSQASAAVQATASVSDTNVFLGDIFYLNVELNDTGSQYQLDTSGLVDNFTVYRPSRSQQSSYINGDYTATTTWSVRLQAKHTGTFTIPALSLGKVETQPISVTVSQPGKQQQSQETDKIFIENTVDKNQVYLNQPLLLTSKIYISENINDGDIQPPQLAGAEIQRTGKEQQSQIIRNGIRYRIFTYQYQISPSLTGEDTISSPLLVGSIRKSVPINNWQNKIIAEPINIRGNDIKVTVKAIPNNYKGDWLVSEDVRLVEHTNLQAQQYKVGEPITRSISLQVASMPLDQMPEIKLGYDKSLRYYPDQDELTQGTANGLLYSQRTINHAVIASQSGTLVLPKISIPWWNSKTDQQEYATIPAQVLTILPADKTAKSPVPSATETASVDKQVQASQTTEPVTTASSNQLLFWQIISALLFIALMVLTVLYYRAKQQKVKGEIAPELTIKDTDEYQNLLLALKAEQPQQVYAALMRYMQSQQPRSTQLQQICAYSALDEQDQVKLRNNLQQLEQVCAGKTHQWDANELLALIKSHHKKTNPHQDHNFSQINP